jgi:hypothetical protein
MKMRKEDRGGNLKRAEDTLGRMVEAVKSYCRISFYIQFRQQDREGWQGGEVGTVNVVGMS